MTGSRPSLRAQLPFPRVFHPVEGHSQVLPFSPSTTRDENRTGYGILERAHPCCHAPLSGQWTGRLSSTGAPAP
eukprot:scaffold2094_cov239-Pinguiococcus_pyrenoidosus.AAC.13